jgi:hypothetical protein
MRHDDVIGEAVCEEEALVIRQNVMRLVGDTPIIPSVVLPLLIAASVLCMHGLVCVKKCVRHMGRAASDICG